MTQAVHRALIFGASGQIGGACLSILKSRGFEVIGTARRPSDHDRSIVSYDPCGEGDASEPPSGRFDAVVWAQGANMNDSIEDFDVNGHLGLYKANTLFVAASLHKLLQQDRLAQGARLCVISSVWQRLARRNKFSYMVTKAALQGLVMSAAIDLADRGILINAVLPGALDTPMTHANLSAGQIRQVADSTPFRRLASLTDVAETVAFLCAPSNTSITGEFIVVDLGFQHARLV